MAAIPTRLPKPVYDPRSLYLRRKGNHSTLLFYQFQTFQRGTPDYKAATEAQTKYFNMRPFEAMYFKLMRAAIDASLSLDRHSGDLVITVPRSSLIGLVSRVVIEQAVDKAKGAAVTLVLGARLANWFGILKQLADIKKRIGNEKLLSKNDSVSKQKRFREKLKLVAVLVGKSQGGNPWRIQLTLLANYDKYEKARTMYLINKLLRLQ